MRTTRRTRRRRRRRRRRRQRRREGAARRGSGRAPWRSRACAQGAVAGWSSRCQGPGRPRRTTRRRLLLRCRSRKAATAGTLVGRRRRCCYGFGCQHRSSCSSCCFFPFLVSSARATRRRVPRQRHCGFGGPKGAHGRAATDASGTTPQTTGRRTTRPRRRHRPPPTLLLAAATVGRAKRQRASSCQQGFRE